MLEHCAKTGSYTHTQRERDSYRCVEAQSSVSRWQCSFQSRSTLHAPLFLFCMNSNTQNTLKVTHTHWQSWAGKRLQMLPCALTTPNTRHTITFYDTGVITSMHTNTHSHTNTFHFPLEEIGVYIYGRKDKRGEDNRDLVLVKHFIKDNPETNHSALFVFGNRL